MNRNERRAGFNMIELLTVIGIILIVITISIPLYARMRANAETLQCGSNLRQLFQANLAYATANGHFVAAAPDMAYPPGTNLRRWHGERDHRRDPFDASRSPLLAFMGTGESIRRCPTFSSFRTGAEHNAFESSCGGYGYNTAGVGSQSYLFGFNGEALAQGMKPAQIQDPARTVMFTDAAFPQPYGRPEYLIEYSFAEAYRFLSSDEPVEMPWTASPSIHFRHREHTNVIWCDGHLSTEKLTTQGTAGSTEFGIGWFGAADNKLFDPF